MSTHDTADRALVERLQAMYARCVFQRPCDEHEAFKEAAAALARRIAEGARLLDALTAAQTRLRATEQEMAVIDNVCDEAEDEAARLREQVQQARALLNPTCAEETLQGAIRNLQQAHLSEQGNVETLEAQVLALQGELAEAQATITAICVVLAGQAGVTDDELALPCVRRVVEALAALNRSNALLTMTEEGARVLRAERDAALRELAEAQQQIDVVDREVSHVYDHLTRGRISYPHTNAQAVISVIEDLQTQDIDEAVKEATNELRAERDAAREALRPAFLAGFYARPGEDETGKAANPFRWEFSPGGIAADRADEAYKAWAALGQPAEPRREESTDGPQL